MRFIYLILLIFPLLIKAGTHQFREEVLNNLPKELTEIKSGISKDELLKKFDKKIIKQNSEAIFVSYFSDTNDVTFGLRNDHLTYTFIELPERFEEKVKNLFSRIYETLSEKEKKELITLGDQTSHDYGKYYHIDLKKEGIKIKFRNDSQKTLKSLIIFPLEGKK